MSDMGDRLGRALVALHVKNLSTVWVDWLYVYFFERETVNNDIFCLQVFCLPPLAPYANGTT